MSLTIRKALPQDIPSMVALWRQMWDVHAQADPRFVVTSIAGEVMGKWFEENMRSDRALLLVAVADRAIAYCHALIMENPPVVPHLYYGYISEIAVDETARRKGAGRLLVQNAHAWFAQKNLPYVEVNVSVRNAVSRSFWRKCGYAEYLERLRCDL